VWVPTREGSTVLGWWSLYGAQVGFVVGLAAVVFGYVGYRQAFSGASWWDSSYAALQLLVLSGGVKRPGFDDCSCVPWVSRVQLA